MANQYISEKLTENTEIEVRGTLKFSRLTSLIEGEELARRNQNKMYPVNGPHTTLTLSNPQILPADPNQLSYNEAYIQERFYTSKKNPQDGQQFSIDSKSTDLPIIAVPNDDGTYTQDVSGQELAAGLDVTVTIRVYKPQNYEKRGTAISMVRLNEPVRYYSAGGPNLSNLAARGIVFTQAPRAIPGSQANSTGEIPEMTDYDGPDAQNENYGLPTPQPAPVGGYPTAAPQAQQQAAAPQAQQPAQPPATAVGFQPQAQAQSTQQPTQAPTEQPQPQAAAPQGQSAPTGSEQPSIEELQAQLAALQAKAGQPDGGSAITGNPWNGSTPAPGITLPNQG